jgi:3-methyladenine DNA glycosylase AlkD
MHHELIADIQARFATLANPQAAVSMRAYMRNQFPFFGIVTPTRRSALIDFKKLPLAQEPLLTLVQQLWQLPEREYRYAAIDLLAMHRKQLDESAIPALLALARQDAWWDTVDNLSSVINRIIRCFPAAQAQMDEALKYDNFWTRRTAMIHQLGWRDATDETRLFDYALTLAPESEFFIRKAIGWALRDYARWQPEAVRAFVLAHREGLSSLTVREAMKHFESSGGRR